MIPENTSQALDPKYIAVIISSIIAVFGWLISSYINTRTFKRNETSKLKDKISSMVESFFDSLEEKIKSRGVKETELDDLIAGKLTLIELHLNHLDRKINIKLISDEHINKIRSEPYDYLTSSNGDYRKKLNELKFNTLELIEENYTEWYFRNSTKYHWLKFKSLIFQK
ncbi:hypothetical protein I5532_20380 [Citrobacter freundii]|uniref:hypothetical protein n=1 Tax=Citrobacter freundii TaxID=546 RepID=UPI0019055FEF|nr:hypothetical protein [Citrobacter freundii]MBJ9634995.1 hypothetical protein [Citrobacter freundii]